MATTAVTLDTSQLARLLDITPRRVNQLAADGVLKRARDETGTELSGRWEMIANNHAYIHFLQRAARLDTASESTFVAWRNVRVQSEAEIAQMRARQLRGELLHRDDVQFWITNTLTAFRARMLAIPSRTARLIVGQTDFQTIFDLIQTEIELALRELSVLEHKQFAEQSKQFLKSLGVEIQQRNGQNTKQNEDTGNSDDVAGGFAAE